MAGLDDLLRRHWVHPAGSIIRLGSAVIDSGHHADQVYGFTRPRMSRRIVAGKGVAGFSRPSLAWAAAGHAVGADRSRRSAGFISGSHGDRSRSATRSGRTIWTS